MGPLFFFHCSTGECRNSEQSTVYLEVSKNRGGPPKWMVKIMENPIKMDDLEGNPHYFRKHPHVDNHIITYYNFTLFTLPEN